VGGKHNPVKKAAYNRAWFAANYQYVLTLKDRPCADCGVKYPPYVMDFDHVRGTKTSNLNLARYHSRSWIDREVAKCDVVCANCHRERTHNRRK